MTSTARRLALATATPSQPANASGSNSGGRRQCWECQRRRVVCDGVRPVCGKCKATDIVCPGYEDKKPLTWLAPGKVKTRTWKRKVPSVNKSDASEKAPPKPKATQPDPYTENPPAERHLIHLFPVSSLRTEACDVIEATMYWNEQIYPAFANNQLANSPWIVPVKYIHFLPKAIQHALTSMAIDHRMIKIGSKKADPYMAEVRSRFHQHRCTALSELNEMLANDLTRTLDTTFATILVFMYADLMGSLTALNWRHHLNGMYSLMELRGGFHHIYNSVKHLRSMLFFIKLLETLANSTSPAHDQVQPVFSYENIDIIETLFETGYYPMFPCPIEIFLDIIRVNRLRYLVATGSLPEDAGTPQSAAEDVVTKIIEFSPEAWAATQDKEREAEFVQAGQAYHSAAVLFGISSLQGLGALPSSAGWRAVRIIHYQRLFSVLEKSEGSVLLRNCMQWPLIVAGFEATTGTQAARTFIARRLGEVSHDLAVYLPLAVRELFKEFWASGERLWDDCFDKPYAFVT